MAFKRRHFLRIRSKGCDRLELNLEGVPLADSARKARQRNAEGGTAGRFRLVDPAFHLGKAGLEIRIRLRLGVEPAVGGSDRVADRFRAGTQRADLAAHGAELGCLRRLLRTDGGNACLHGRHPPLGGLGVDDGRLGLGHALFKLGNHRLQGFDLVRLDGGLSHRDACFGIRKPAVDFSNKAQGGVEVVGAGQLLGVFAGGRGKLGLNIRKPALKRGARLLGAAQFTAQALDIAQQRGDPRVGRVKTPRHVAAGNRPAHRAAGQPAAGECRRVEKTRLPEDAGQHRRADEERADGGHHRHAAAGAAIGSRRGRIVRRLVGHVFRRAVDHPRLALVVA